MKNNLLKAAPKALQFLHAEKGMDFEKPFVYVEGSGKFTLKSLEKFANLENVFDYTIALFVKTRSSSYDLSYVSIDAFCGFNIEIARWNYRNYRIDNFCTKRMFEDLRKSYANSDKYYLVAQKKEFLQPVTQKNIDLSERFKMDLTSRIYKAGDGHGKHWISEIKLKSTTSDGKSFDYKPYEHCQISVRSDVVSDIIDKSGYLLIDNLSNLVSRAAQRRADKAKAEAMQADYSKKNAEYNSIIEGLKQAISKRLLLATTNDDVNVVQSAMYYFQRLYSGFKRHLSDIEYNKYLSISAIEREFTAMNGYIVKVNNALNGNEN